MVLSGTHLAAAQGLAVLPVTILLPSGQMASTLTIQNQGDSDTTFQVRPFVWVQSAGSDKLTPTDALLVSPPLGSIPSGGTQVVRLMVRRPAQGQEATYRVLLDQIPPPPAPGLVRIAIRMSIPIFVLPATRVAPHLRWTVERDGGQAYLVAVNDGTLHETVRDIAVGAPGGASLKVESNASPYVLAGSTRRWRIIAPGGLPEPGGTLRLTARADSGAIEQPVPVVRVRP